MNNTAARIRRAFLAIIAISTLSLGLSLLGSKRFNAPIRFDMIQLDTGWTISRGNNTWELESVNESNIGIVNNIGAFHTTGHGGINDDGTYQVAYIGSLATCGIDADTHLTQL